MTRQLLRMMVRTRSSALKASVSYDSRLEASVRVDSGHDDCVTPVYSTESTRNYIDINACILLFLFVTSACLRGGLWLSQPKDTRAGRSWLDTPMLILQCAYFLHYVGNGLGLLFLKPSRGSNGLDHGIQALGRKLSSHKGDRRYYQLQVT